MSATNYPAFPEQPIYHDIPETQQPIHYPNAQEKSSGMNTRAIIFISVGVAVVCLGLGIIIGHFGIDSCDEPCLGSSVPKKIIQDADKGITEKILANIKPENIRNNLRNYTREPHMTGMPGDDHLAQTLFDTWKAQGFDHVTMVKYDVLLSFPNKSDPNVVTLFSDNGTVHYITQDVEKILDPEQNHTDVIGPFNAYSPDGEVQAPLVYVNYGRVEDFETLEKNYNISVSGKLVIVRYGQIFRGDKVRNANERGALGVIIYSDPADYSINSDQDVYPHSWWLPGTGVQRGSVGDINNGDPLTPGYPSTGTAYRRNESDSDLPKIPSQPIGYDDAREFLSRMGGVEAPVEWRGRLNITYKLGPGFDQQHSTWTVKLHVANRYERYNASNVFAYINGSVEPDRYVMLGNHRDAWVFGSVDPTSGTAAMMEVSRVLSDLVKNGGWRPRRTLVFCSWGAEEQGIIGSFEWVEDVLKNLISRAVTYINVDIAVKGQAALSGKSVPILYDVLYNVTKSIPSPNNKSISMYEEWRSVFPDNNNPHFPVIQPLGSGSDHAAFLGKAGVPCIDYTYTHNYPIIDYPVYHSIYETFDYFDRLLDPQYNYSTAMAQLWAETARYIADSLVLPINASQYGLLLQIFIVDLDKEYGQRMREQGIVFDDLYSAATEYQTASDEFMRRLRHVNKKNPLEVRMYNDQLLELERAFTDAQGIPLRPFHKHILFAPSAFNSYAGSTFPGLVDLMYGIDDLSLGGERERRWEEVKHHISVIIYCINSAVKILKPVTIFQ